MQQAKYQNQEFDGSLNPEAEYRSLIRSKKIIYAALADLSTEKPIDKITVTDIVNRADINRGTFYAHFSDVPDVIKHTIQQTFSSIQEALSHHHEPLSQIGNTLLTQIQKILEEDLPFYQKILNSSASALMYNQLVEIVSEYLVQNKELFYHGDIKEYEFAIHFCAGGLRNIYKDWFSGKLSYSLHELTEISTKFIQRTITAIDK